MSRVLSVALGLVWFCAGALGQEGRVEVGEEAPPIALEALLQAPEDAEASWEALEGKAVVLEFWATWCGPCIAAIPHLNELAREFADEPIQFIAITDEDRETIESFLEGRSMEAWIGLDADRSALEAYGVRAIPHTVLVTAGGEVAAVTHPTRLTGEHLRALIDGDELGLGEPRAAPRPVAAGADGAADGVKPARVEVSIRPSAAEGTGTRSRTGSHDLELENVTLHSIISSAWQVRASRIIADDLPEGRFDVTARVPPEGEGLHLELLQAATEAAFGLEVVEETRELDAYVLTLPEGLGPEMEETATTGGSSTSRGPGMLESVNAPVESILGLLETSLGCVVIDRSGLDERYDLRLEWEAGSAEALNEAAREQLGLHLEEEAAPVEVLVVRRKGEQVAPERAAAATAD